MTAQAPVVTARARVLPFPFVPIDPLRARRRPRRRGAATGATVGVVGIVVLAVLAGCGQGGRDRGAGEDTGAGGGAEATATTEPGPDTLDDGDHEVLVTAVDAAGATATVDGVQVLSGMDAVLAYLADTDGAQLEGAQWYVRNTEAVPQELPVDASGSFSVIRAEACCETVAVAWPEFAASATGGFADLWGRNPPFAATVEDGTITSLTQVHIP